MIYRGETLWKTIFSNLRSIYWGVICIQKYILHLSNWLIFFYQRILICYSFLRKNQLCNKIQSYWRLKENVWIWMIVSKPQFQQSDLSIKTNTCYFDHAKFIMRYNLCSQVFLKGVWWVCFFFTWGGGYWCQSWFWY